MANAPQPQSWWHTLPGVLTALAGVITALGGLILALNQVGVWVTKPDGEDALGTRLVVNGKVDAVDGKVPFSVTISAERSHNGSVTGEFSYSGTEQFFKSKAECLTFDMVRKIVSVTGPVIESRPQRSEGEWGIVEILRDDNSNMKLSVRHRNRQEALDLCRSPSNTQSGVINQDQLKVSAF
jgi:hypothetical protein